MEIALFLLLVEAIENGSYLGSKNSFAPGGEGCCPREFLPYHNLCEKPEAGAAVFLRDIEEPKPHFLGFLLQSCFDLRFELIAITAVHLDGD